MSAEDKASLTSAIQAYEAGNLAAARPSLLRLATKYPKQVEVQTATGMTLAESGDLKEALPYLQCAHRLAPRDADISGNLAVALIKSGAPGEAVTLLTEASSQQPDNPVLMIHLAQAQMEAANASAAAKAYSAGARLMQQQGVAVDDDLRHDWAVALLTANDPGQALTVLHAAPDQESSAPLQELLGEAEEQSHHFESAAQHFKRAAELDPSEANLYSYATELMRHWTFPAAIQVLTYAAQRYPSSERMRTALGVAYYGNADYEKAVPVFADLLGKDPNSSTAADLLGRSCSALGGAQQEGCTSLRRFAEAHPANAEASLFAGVAILHQPADKQDAVAAEALLRNAVRVNPKLADAWYQLAVLQQSRNDWAGSADLLHRALQQRPDYPEAHYRLARALSHLGKRDEAQQEIALQQKYAGDAKAEEERRMKEVTTFLVTAN
ncbi:tetratricopeptide repeat protein [Terriglobus aquaticus]|uniref:Tetratricopeptide repeat protein n=1 Tax=Terriglobus aquaticus TaxID=940139 RepID=A0ABW9KNH4_9BACT|nr:tetratricopeptide repeat protein [Terriglobus aquaticus]